MCVFECVSDVEVCVFLCLYHHNGGEDVEGDGRSYLEVRPRVGFWSLHYQERRSDLSFGFGCAGTSLGFRRRLCARL